MILILVDIDQCGKTLTSKSSSFTGDMWYLANILFFQSYHCELWSNTLALFLSDQQTFFINVAFHKCCIDLNFAAMFVLEGRGFLMAALSGLSRFISLSVACGDIHFHQKVRKYPKFSGKVIMFFLFNFKLVGRIYSIDLRWVKMVLQRLQLLPVKHYIAHSRGFPSSSFVQLEASSYYLGSFSSPQSTVCLGRQTTMKTFQCHFFIHL